MKKHRKKPRNFLIHFLICMETINQANPSPLPQISADSPTISLSFQHIARLNTLRDSIHLKMIFDFVFQKFLLKSLLRATFNPKRTRSDPERQQLIMIIFLLPWPSSRLFYHVLPITNLI